MLFSILKTLALGVWLGSLLMLGIAVAGPIFQQSPSKTLAGNINQIILSRMNTIEWVCGILAFVCSLVMLVMYWNSDSRNLRITESALILIMLGLLWSYSSYMSSRMNELRGIIKNFDHPALTTEYTTAKAEFDTLHKRYTQVVSVNMILLIGTFVISMVTAKKS